MAMEIRFAKLVDMPKRFRSLSTAIKAYRPHSHGEDYPRYELSQTPTLAEIRAMGNINKGEMALELSSIGGKSHVVFGTEYNIGNGVFWHGDELDTTILHNHPAKIVKKTPPFSFQFSKGDLDRSRTVLLPTGVLRAEERRCTSPPVGFSIRFLGRDSALEFSLESEARLYKYGEKAELDPFTRQVFKSAGWEDFGVVPKRSFAISEILRYRDETLAPEDHTFSVFFTKWEDLADLFPHYGNDLNVIFNNRPWWHPLFVKRDVVAESFSAWTPEFVHQFDHHSALLVESPKPSLVSWHEFFI